MSYREFTPILCNWNSPFAYLIDDIDFGLSFWPVSTYKKSGAVTITAFIKTAYSAN